MSFLIITYDGKDFFLQGPAGDALKFADDVAVDAFIQSMTGGTDVFMSAVLNQGIFPEIAAGDMDAVAAFYADYMEAADILFVAGRAERFIAAEREAASIAECIIAAGRWLLALFVAKASEAKGKTIEIPSRRETEDLRRLTLAMRDPKKRAEALQIQKEFKAKLLAEKNEPSKAGVVTRATSPPDYGQTWFNITGGQTLKLYKHWLSPESIMTVVTYPAKEFKIGSQGLAWSWIASGWLQGPMDGYVIWDAPNGSWFGLNIHCPTQVLGIGTAPYYEVAWSQPGKNNWHIPVDDPAFPFEFPTSLGYKVEVKTQCGHASIAVIIQVLKLSSSDADVPLEGMEKINKPVD